MIPMQFTGTECVRPKLNEASYMSFHENLVGVDWGASTLFLNIDPLPKGADPTKVIEVAEKFFGTVKPRITRKPNATAALQWCWLQPTEPYFFHLQADWALRKKFNIRSMIKLLVKQKLIAVNLRCYSKKKFELCLSPSLVRTREAKRIARALRLDWNAERQLRKRKKNNPNGRDLQGKMRSIHIPPRGKVIFDIGRAWLNEHNYKRNDGCNFTTWANKR